MTDVITFEFYSDTNLSNAFDELQLMSLDVLERQGTSIVIGAPDMQAMGDSIDTIISYNGGELVE